MKQLLIKLLTVIFGTLLVLTLIIGVSSIIVGKNDSNVLIFNRTEIMITIILFGYIFKMLWNNYKD